MPSSPARNPSAHGRQDGYVYLLMLALLIVGSLYGLLRHLDPKALQAEQPGTTARALTTARDALLGYAATYREFHPDEGYGHLPCPDTDGDGVADGNCSSTTLGLLPYRTLGLPDLRDASGACLWYAVAARFKNNPKSDPLNWDAQGELVITDASGANIVAAPDDSNGGVAAIVFAPGASLAGQDSGKLDSGFPCRAAPTQPELYLESTAAPFKNGADSSGSSVNDQLLWLSSADVFARIRARNDFATYLNAGIKGIQSALSFALPAPASGKLLPTVPPLSLSASDQRFYLQWQDQFRYLKCATSGSYCYTLGSRKCDGVLLFGGERSDGRPRPTGARALSDYFEGTTLDLADGSSQTLATPSTLYATTSLATRSQDLALCLSPQTQSADQDSDTPLVVSSSVDAGFNTLNPVPAPVARYLKPDSGQATFQLGQTGGNGATDGYGCLWYPEPFQLGAGSTPIHLRAYFAFTIDTLGQGFVFAIADADSSSNPHATICGASGSALGYAGDNGVTASIAYPKLGLEIDTHKDVTLGDGDAGHLALVYWGDNLSLKDDNAHGDGNNPDSASTGYRAFTLAAGTTYYVRLDLERSYASLSDTATQVIHAYISPYGTSYCPQFADLSDDLPNLFTSASPGSVCMQNTLVGTQTLTRRSDGPVPMKQVWIGFTSGQDSSGQRIRIQPFKMQISQ